MDVFKLIGTFLAITTSIAFVNSGKTFKMMKNNLYRLCDDRANDTIQFELMKIIDSIQTFVVISYLTF